MMQLTKNLPKKILKNPLLLFQYSSKYSFSSIPYINKRTQLHSTFNPFTTLHAETILVYNLRRPSPCDIGRRKSMIPESMERLLPDQ